MKAIIITPNYPNVKSPQNGSFVHQLLLEWEKIGLDPLVINPISVPYYFRCINRKKFIFVQKLFSVRRPLYFTFSNGYIFGHNFNIFKSLSFYYAVKSQNVNFHDAAFFYGKFMLTGGFAITKLKEKYNLPTFVDIGESTLIESLDQKELHFVKGFIKKIDGFVCVSDKLKKELLELGAKEDDILLALNGVDLEKFNILNKAECRRKIGLDNDDFVIIFVGHFIERKGPDRIIKALNLLNVDIKALFIGEGTINVDSGHTFFQGTVINEELPTYLNCADLFVLPTLAEGNCNAINEAKACGIPILSSDISEIKEQVSGNEGVLVNPLSIKEIANGINFFYKNPIQKEIFIKNLIEKRDDLSLRSRVQKIDQWIKFKIKYQC